MFALRITFNRAALDAMKADLTKTLPEVKSSHRCEALARAFGFSTYAAARAATHQRLSGSRRESDGRAFASYLAEHGFQVNTSQFYLAVGRVAVMEILAAEPNLTLEGIGVGLPLRFHGRWETLKERMVRFDVSRAELLSHDTIEQFLRALACVIRIAVTKHPSDRNNSYSLKHLAEQLPCTYPDGQRLGPDYVTNGALIAAAIHAGFRYKTHSLGMFNSQNVSFNMRKRSIDALQHEQLRSY